MSEMFESLIEENQSLRKQLAEANTILRAENARLHACAESDTREITRLKNEVGDLRVELSKNKVAREWINKWSNEIIEHWQLPYPATIELRDQSK